MDVLNNSSRSLFVLYLMVSSNYLGNLFSCKTQEAFQTNMLIKHLLGFLTLYFFISIVDTTQNTPAFKLLSSIIIYICFIISTKMNQTMWIVFITLLAFVYMLYVFRDSIEGEQTKTNISYIQLGAVITAMAVLLSGFIYYMGEKKIEYKSDFSYGTFLFGTPTCKGYTPEIRKSVTDIMLIGVGVSSP